MSYTTYTFVTLTSTTADCATTTYYMPLNEYECQEGYNGGWAKVEKESEFAIKLDDKLFIIE